MDLALTLALAGVILLVALSFRLFRPSPRIEIGDRGILDRSLALGWIRWEEIEGAYQRRSQEHDAVFLRLRATERLLRKLRRAGRADATSVGQPFDLRLDLSDSEVSAVELMQEIMAHPSGPSESRPASGWPTVPSRGRG